MPELEDDTDEEVLDKNNTLNGELDPDEVPNIGLPERREWCRKAIIEGNHPDFQGDPSFVEFWQPTRRKSTSVCDTYGLRIKIDQNDGTTAMYFICLEGECAGPRCFGKRIKMVHSSTDRLRVPGKEYPTVRATAHLKEFHNIISRRSLLNEERRREKQEIGPPPSTSFDSPPYVAVPVKRENSVGASPKRRGRPPKRSKLEPCSENEGDGGGQTYDNSRRGSFHAVGGRQYEKEPIRKRKQSLSELEKTAKKLRSEILLARSKLNRILADEESAKGEFFEVSEELARIESGQFYSTQAPESVSQRLKILRAKLARLKDKRATCETLMNTLRNSLYETELDVAECECDEQMKGLAKPQARATPPETSACNDEDNDSVEDDD